MDGRLALRCRIGWVQFGVRCYGRKVDRRAILHGGAVRGPTGVGIVGQFVVRPGQLGSHAIKIHGFAILDRHAVPQGGRIHIVEPDRETLHNGKRLALIHGNLTGNGGGIHIDEGTAVENLASIGGGGHGHVLALDYDLAGGCITTVPLKDNIVARVDICALAQGHGTAVLYRRDSSTGGGEGGIGDAHRVPLIAVIALGVGQPKQGSSGGEGTPVDGLHVAGKSAAVYGDGILVAVGSGHRAILYGRQGTLGELDCV